MELTSPKVKCYSSGDRKGKPTTKTVIGYMIPYREELDETIYPSKWVSVHNPYWCARKPEHIPRKWCYLIPSITLYV